MTESDTSITPWWQRKWVAWVTDLLIVGAFVAVVYWPLVFTDQTLATDEFWSDLISLAQPTYEYSGTTLASGNLPLWNPYWFCGYPHLAMPSAGIFYPTTILYGLASFEEVVKPVMLIHLFLAGAFSYALGRTVIGGRIPSLFLALFGVCGDLLLPSVRNGQLWTLQTLTWFPLVVLLIHRILGKGRWVTTVALAVAIALMVFAGDPQALAFCFWFLGPYTLVLIAVRVWSKPGDLKLILRRSALCLTAIVLGGGLAAVQLVPSQELLQQSIRAEGLTYDYLSMGVMGGANPFKPFLWLQEDGTTYYIAAGRTIIALALTGLLLSRRVAPWAAALAAISCLPYILLTEWFYAVLVQHLPVFDGVRGTFRMIFVLWWCVAYLSAFGVDVWIRTCSAARARDWFVPVVTIATLVIFIALPVAAGYAIPLPRVLAWLMVAVGACVFLIRRRVPYAARAALVLVVGGAGFEVIWRSMTLNISGDPAPYKISDDYIEFSTSRGVLDRVGLLPAYHFRHGPAVGMMTHDRQLHGYHGLLLTRYARLFRDAAGVNVAPMDEDGRLDIGDFANAAWVTDYFTEVSQPIIDLLNVRHVVAIGNRNRLAPKLVEPRGPFRLVQPGQFLVYENTRAMPPIFPIHSIVECNSDEAALELIRLGKVDTRRELTITGGVAPPVVATDELESITITDYQPERIAANVELAAPAIVVFSEIYYPGWVTFVDGVEQEVLCVDTALRGVFVEAGEHTVVLEYRPASLRRGAAISLSTLVVIAVTSMAIVWRRRRRMSMSVERGEY